MCWFAVVCCESCRLLRIFQSFYNTSHKFWDQSPSPHYQCCFQVFETVPWHKFPCCYSSNILQHWVGGRDQIYSCKLDQSRIFINFSMNWLGLINLCEILKFAVHNSRLLLEGCWGKKKNCWWFWVQVFILFFKVAVTLSVPMAMIIKSVIWCCSSALTSQQIFTYSKSTIKTLEKGMEYVQSSNER